MAVAQKRRRLMLAGAAAVGTGAAGVAWIRSAGGGEGLTVAAAIARIDMLAKGRPSSNGAWDLHQVFTHCAQSIEFSMRGYPSMKSALFQYTAGAAAFAVFDASGRMTHNLAEQIPGAPALERRTDFLEGLARLRGAFVDFDAFGGTLAPHFAYGALTKKEYAKAHVMHFYNHLDEISA